MAPPVALLDANVLYPAGLRSFLLYLAVHGLFRPKWTEEIHEEWISNLLFNRRDLTRAKLERTRDLMKRAAPDATVTGYGRIIPTLHLPDGGDRHVLAAAIRSKAGIIVTDNLKDFPAEILARFGIEAQSPDDFVAGLFALSGNMVFDAAEAHRLSLKNPPKPFLEYLEILETQGLVRTARLLKRQAER